MHRHSLVWLFLFALAVCVGSARGQGLCPGDLDGNSIVNADDLGIMLSEFGCTAGYFGACSVVEPNGADQPGCSADPACESIVCASDPFCCNTLWDEICADGARFACPFTSVCTGDLNADLVVDADDLSILLSGFGCFPTGVCGLALSGSCCVANGTPGCDDGLCCLTVCGVDPSCCAVAWDQGCAALAQSLCPLQCAFPVGACCYPDGSCGQLIEPNCQLTGGAFQGAGTTCESACVPAVSCGSGAAGDCCSANGTPFCDNASCCLAVCAQDPMCCSDAWDEVCASLAGFVCGILCTPDGACCFGDGSCIVAFKAVCLSVGGVYQGDGTLCDVVCPQPPACGDPNAGECCVPNGTPFCDDAACCAAVCATDPFCCASAWDAACAEQAFTECAACSIAPGACCLPDGSCVLANPTFCAMAGGVFEGSGTACGAGACPAQIPCGDPGAGSCCVANGTPSCDDAACCAAVCAADPFCCETEWDDLCASQASAACMACGAAPACGIVGTGSCCNAQPEAFCDDAACCSLICALDAFCCTARWDEICAGDAKSLCDISCLTGACCYADGSCDQLSPLECNATGGTFVGFNVSCEDACEPAVACGSGDTGDCCVPNGTPYCNDSPCCEFVCSTDPFCCTEAWDEACSMVATQLCAICFIVTGCGSFAAGDCCEANSTPYCSDTACCETICQFDPFCCDTQWDEICAFNAAKFCAGCMP